MGGRHDAIPLHQRPVVGTKEPARSTLVLTKKEKQQIQTYLDAHPDSDSGMGMTMMADPWWDRL